MKYKVEFWVREEGQHFVSSDKFEFEFSERGFEKAFQSAQVKCEEMKPKGSTVVCVNLGKYVKPRRIEWGNICEAYEWHKGKIKRMIPPGVDG